MAKAARRTAKRKTKRQLRLERLEVFRTKLGDLMDELDEEIDPSMSIYSSLKSAQSDIDEMAENLWPDRKTG